MKKRRMLAGLLAAVMLATTLPQAFAAPQQTAYATRGQVVEMLLAAADDYNPGLKKEDIIQGNGDGDLRELITAVESLHDDLGSIIARYTPTIGDRDFARKVRSAIA